MKSIDEGFVLDNHESRMTADDNPISCGKSAAEEALARLSPHRTHESNRFEALALRSWIASLVPPELDRFGPTTGNPLLPLVFCCQVATPANKGNRLRVSRMQFVMFQPVGQK